MLKIALFAAVCLLLRAAAAAAQEKPDPDRVKAEAAAEVDKLHPLTQQMVDEIFSFSELVFQERDREPLLPQAPMR